MPRAPNAFEVWLPADEERWRAYLDCDDELVFYCPKCAIRERRVARACRRLLRAVELRRALRRSDS